MKNLFLYLLAFTTVFAACDDDTMFVDPESPIVDEGTTRSMFPEDDGSKVLSGSPHIVARDLIKKVPVDYIKEMTDTLGRANITPEQYDEIQAFALELTAGLKTDKEKYDKCFNWVAKNITYGHSDNDPYPVFINRVGVCQGYANLLFIMLHSLGVPSFVCNGILNPLGGHAWNYVYCDGNWYVSDPTNNGSFMLITPSYYSHLFPSSFDVVLYKENGVWYNLSEYHLNIGYIESGDDVYTVPFSVNGLRVTSFSPTLPLPSNIKELYIGKNITTLGENYIGLAHNAPNVEYIEVDPANTAFASYLGTVYRKNGNELQLFFIPGAMTCVELMPMPVIYKNTVYDHKTVESVIIAPGTKSIEAWAFEQCPNLKIAYIPEGVEIAENAFADVHPDFQIIRGDYTNIPQIKED